MEHSIKNKPEWADRRVLALLEIFERQGHTVEMSNSCIVVSKNALKIFIYSRHDMEESFSALIDKRNPGKQHQEHKKKDDKPEDPIDTIKRLKESGRKIIEQREEWKARALKVEEALARGERPKPSNSGATDNRYSELRKYIAFEFHPDRSQAAGIERLIKEEVFKILWRKIDEIDKS